jgi:photosystem II stability/assembly factor-like uncharacterized protein
LNSVRLLAVLAVLAATAAAEWVSVGPDGGNTPAMVVDPQNPSVLYCLPDEFPDTARVFCSTDGGAHWDSIGRFSDYTASRLAVDPTRSEVVYGLSVVELLHRSTDAGRTWQRISLPGRASGIALPPALAGRVYLSGYVGQGAVLPALFVSDDFGASWRASVPDSALNGFYGMCCAADPRNAATVWLGCSDTMVFRSTDAGLTWQRRGQGLPVGTAVNALAVNGSDPNRLLAATGRGVYLSTDAGQSWNGVAGVPLALSVEFAAADPRIAYCVAKDPTPKLFVSSDRGATWSAAMPGLKSGRDFAAEFDAAHANVVFAHGPIGVYRSDDFGDHFEAVNTGMRVGRAMTITTNPVDPTQVFVEMGENGVFRSFWSGQEWERCADFLVCGAVCGIAAAPRAYGIELYALEGYG